MILIQQPVLQWVNPTRNTPVGQGFMYFGEVGQDPKIPANQITVYRKNQLNEYVEVQQPINLSDSGVPIYLGQEMALYVEEDCAIRVDDRNGAEQYLIRQYFGAQDDTLRSDLADGTADIGGQTAQSVADLRGDLTILSGIKALKQVSGVVQTTLGYHTNSGVGGYQYQWNPARSWLDHNGGTVLSSQAMAVYDGTTTTLAAFLNFAPTAGSGCWELIATAGAKKADFFGALGDCDSETMTGTNDTAAYQALIKSIEDNDTVYGFGRMLIDRDGAQIFTVDGVSSYLGVISGKNGFTIDSSFQIYQKHHPTLDTVGLAIVDCKKFNLNLPAFDGGFRYTSTTSINYKQQLLHLIRFKSASGSFRVSRSSNVGFLLSNDYGYPFDQTEINDSVFDSIISENCLQNSTFGSGVNKVEVGSFVCLNPIVSAIKFSSNSTDPSVKFNGVRINNFSVSFDSSYQNPLNEAGTAANNALAILDNVSSAAHCSYGHCYFDFDNVTIPSIAIKQHTRPASTSSQPSGPISIDKIVVKNQSVTNSVVLEIDSEATGTNVGEMELYNISKAVQIYKAIPSSTIQPTANKFLNVGKITSIGNNRALVNIVDYTADFILIGAVLQRGDVGAFQAVNIESSCTVNIIKLPYLDVKGQLRLKGKFVDVMELNGRVDCAQAVAPVDVIAVATSGTLNYSLFVSGDSGVTRKIPLENITHVTIGRHSLTGVPLGFVINNVTEVNVADTSPKYEDLTAIMPFTVNSISTVFKGTVSYIGSPTGTLFGSAGLMYKASAAGGEGALYIKKFNSESGDSLLGWRRFATTT